TGAVYVSPTVSNPTPTPALEINCPAGQKVVGIEGGQGSLLDRIGIYCDSITAAPLPLSEPLLSVDHQTTFVASALDRKERLVGLGGVGIVHPLLRATEVVVDGWQEAVAGQVVEEDRRRFAAPAEAAIEFR